VVPEVAKMDVETAEPEVVESFVPQNNGPPCEVPPAIVEQPPGNAPAAEASPPVIVAQPPGKMPAAESSPAIVAQPPDNAPAAEAPPAIVGQPPGHAPAAEASPVVVANANNNSELPIAADKGFTGVASDKAEVQEDGHKENVNMVLAAEHSPTKRKRAREEEDRSVSGGDGAALSEPCAAGDIGFQELASSAAAAGSGTPSLAGGSIARTDPLVPESREAKMATDGQEVLPESPIPAVKREVLDVPVVKKEVSDMATSSPIVKKETLDIPVVKKEISDTTTSSPMLSKAPKKPMKLKMGHVAGRQVDQSGRLAAGVQALFFAKDFCDATLICGEATFTAHKVVLAGQSDVLRELLKGKDEVRLAETSMPEAVQLMLDFLYEVGDETGYAPSTHQVNKDVLFLAERFHLLELKRRAAAVLARDITTQNAMERITICETLGLADIRDRILNQLASNKKALAEFSSFPEVKQHPQLLRDVLKLVTATPAEGEPTISPQTKRARKST